MDDELARFEAELKSLEQTESKKRPRDDEEEQIKAPLAKKEKVAAPKVYMAPPRPAPVKKVNTQASQSQAPASHTVPNTIDAVHAHRSAISAPSQPANNQPAPLPASATFQPRLPTDVPPPNNILQPYKKGKKHVRMAGGQIWEDPTLDEWPENDFRLFCGDLGNEVSDELLAQSFVRYDSFQKARVVRDKHTHKSKGFGFVSFSDAFDCAKALREMNGRYIGNRPVKLSKSNWQERNIQVARKKQKKKKHLF